MIMEKLPKKTQGALGKAIRESSQSQTVAGQPSCKSSQELNHGGL